MTRPRAPRPIPAALAAAALLILLAACAPTGSQSVEVTPSVTPTNPTAVPVDPDFDHTDIPVIADLPYTDQDDPDQSLDACFPTGDTDGPRASVILVHGGSWQFGDKARNNMREICQWLAAEGFVAVSVNYRLAPEFTYPAALLDVQSVVRWLRDPQQVAAYNLDPDRIGAFGGSAGGNLAALLGTSGEGAWNAGVRVAAVVDFSGPTDLRVPFPTTDSFDEHYVLEYLGCDSLDACPAAASASPISPVDATDPPFFVAHSTDDFIPIAQADDFVAELRANGVDTTYVTVEGALHSMAMLDDDMRSRVLAFLNEKLAEPLLDLGTGTTVG